ncbi:MAG TPA: hypothetical protein VMB26_09750, partial [Candidatus Binataceae bacterium]|nr:hypothetical protein [Candidatus Binataceae bacterium]
MKMWPNIRREHVLAIMMFIATIVGTPRLAAAKGARPPLLAVQVVHVPDPMTAFGKAYVVYELALTSYDSSAIDLTSLRVS